MPLLNDETEVIKDLLDHLQDPEFNDVTIEASDGKVSANRTILSVRSLYFRSMLSANNNFVESSTGQVKLPYPKAVIEKVVFYIYSGRMDCADMDLRLLLDLLELLNLMNLPSKYSKVEAFTLQNITAGKYPLSDCLRSLEDSSKMVLQSVGETLLSHLGQNFLNISSAVEVGELSEAMISRLLEEQKEEETQTIHRLETFLTWLSVNSMEEEKKDEVLQTLDFEHFTQKELTSVVRKSGLYDIDMIMERIDELFENNVNKFEAKKWELETINGLLKTKEGIIAAKEQEKAACLRLKDEEINQNNQKINQMTADMKTVKSCFKNQYDNVGYRATMWDKFASGDIKARYSHL